MIQPERDPPAEADRAECKPLPLHHGAIGNGRVIALIGPDTNID